ncbi:hypothetical protein AK812_SmicGene44426 [Symbiodinium microadriaticum]|uniref:Uncharacterized protein n=1 Tax=Symbiodinium microadriaticum TaxID=2951 RepID=A0A1Q9BYH3_SYMMI|nr:hypothetical protein AK812_SmicGene44426 [Symbiodinium microadriaticum]
MVIGTVTATSSTANAFLTPGAQYDFVRQCTCAHSDKLRRVEVFSISCQYFLLAVLSAVSQCEHSSCGELQECPFFSFQLGASAAMAGTGGPRPVLVAALKALSEASEEAIMDSLAEFRVSHRDTADEELSGAHVTQTTPDDYADTIPSEVYGYPLDGPQWKLQRRRPLVRARCPRQ